MAFTPVDVSRFGSLSALSVSPSTDQQGAQKVDRESGLPLWRVQVLRTPREGGRASLIEIAVPSRVEPSVTPMTPVVPVDLVAVDWAMNGRHGLSYRASSLEAA